MKTKKMYKLARLFLLTAVFLLCYSYESSGEDPYKLIWTQTYNSSNGSEVEHANNIAIDSTGIYVVGPDFSIGDCQWRIEKRKWQDGSIIWTQTNNVSGGYDAAVNIAVDSTGMYVAGVDESPGNQQWRIEKRSLMDGSVIWTQTVSPSSGSDGPAGISVDSTGIYIVGSDNSPGNFQWRMEKRSLTDGSVIWTQTVNPSSKDDVANAVSVDSTGIYIVGHESYSSPPSTSGRWRIEKRSLTDGTTLWVQTSDPSARNDLAIDVAVNSTGIYVVGVENYYNSPPQYCSWRVEKRNLTDGSIIWAQTSDPSDGEDYAQGVALDSTAIYVVGRDDVPGNAQWRIEKRHLTDGSLIWTETSNPSNAFEEPYDVAVDLTGIYVVGRDYSPGNDQWRMEKYSIGTVIPPIVNIPNPKNGATVSGMTTINANAEAYNGESITRVEFYVDGAIKHTDNISPYEYTWDTTLEKEGNHTIKAIAYDTINQSATDEISVTVKQKAVDIDIIGDVILVNPVAKPTKGDKIKIKYSIDMPQDKKDAEGAGTKVRVRITIHTIRGTLVKTLADEEMALGEYQQYWDGINVANEVVASGVYILKIEAGNFKSMKKIVVVK